MRVWLGAGIGLCLTPQEWRALTRVSDLLVDSMRPHLIGLQPFCQLSCSLHVSSGLLQPSCQLKLVARMRPELTAAGLLAATGGSCASSAVHMWSGCCKF